jgi:hypothetical protein
MVSYGHKISVDHYLWRVSLNIFNYGTLRIDTYGFMIRLEFTHASLHTQHTFKDRSHLNPGNACGNHGHLANVRPFFG